MINTINQNEFTNTMATDEMGFSYDGAKALFNYLEELENDCDTKIEFDAIALRCEYTEYDSYDEIFDNYSCTFDIDVDSEEYAEMSDLEKYEKVSYYTQVIEFGNGVIIAEF